MLGIIGGTGLGEALFGVNFREEHAIDTPFGAPSSLIRTLSWAGLDVAVLNRHGEGHVIPPSSVPYRANIFALKKLGVTHLLVSGAVGSLREEIRPRDLVIVDQTIDRTYRRVPTFFDEGMAVHVELANPYCAALRERLLAASPGAHAKATYVCIEGPSFSSVAESHEAFVRARGPVPGRQRALLRGRHPGRQRSDAGSVIDELCRPPRSLRQSSRRPLPRALHPVPRSALRFVHRVCDQR